MKIYIYGVTASLTSEHYKVGRSEQHLSRRAGQRTTGDFYARASRASETLLAAFHSDAATETRLKNHFRHLAYEHEDGKTEAERFRPDPEIEEWINWLRHQDFTWLTEDEGPDDYASWAAVAPRPERRMALPVSNALFSEEETRPPAPGSLDLRGTPWSKYAIYRPPWSDYYTPRWIIEAARSGMGGIDLDGASHWSANKIHQIPRYFTAQSDAHKQVWSGRVWLNPPYGNNEPWIRDILKHWESRQMTQLCWLSPSYVFNKKQAQPIMDLASLVICLTCPTDTMFWGWASATKGGRKEMYCGPDEPSLGINQPHWIIYLGDRPDQVADAFLATEKGYPMTPYRAAVTSR